jgi:hypothetical protein
MPTVYAGILPPAQGRVNATEGLGRKSVPVSGTGMEISEVSGGAMPRVERYAM